MKLRVQEWLRNMVIRNEHWYVFSGPGTVLGTLLLGMGQNQINKKTLHGSGKGRLEGVSSPGRPKAVVLAKTSYH